MAVFETGTYDSPTDLLAKFRSFILAVDGYSEHLYEVEGDGYRFHFTKVTGSLTFNFNMRAAMHEDFPNNPWDNGAYYGVCINESTSFDDSLHSLLQPGSPSVSDYGAPQGGILLCNLSTVKDYTFTASDTSFSITADGRNDLLQHLIGLASECAHGHLCNSQFTQAYSILDSDSYDYLLVSDSYSFKYGSGLLLNSGVWRYLYGRPTATLGLLGLFDVSAGFVGTPLLDNSPNTSLGIPVLFPLALTYGTYYYTINSLYQADGLDGIKVLNKKYLNDGDIITVGGLDYIVYTANPETPNYGLAFQIS